MEVGFIEFFDIKCIYVKDSTSMTLKLINNSDLHKVYENLGKKDFFLYYESFIYKKSCVLVKSINVMFDYQVELNIAYTLRLLADEEIAGLLFKGDEIDSFFSPIEYYFRLHNEKKEHTDLLYGKELVDNFKFKLIDEVITIDLYYGKILSRGNGSDLKLHAHLDVKFSPTKDLIKVRKIVDIIYNFLKVVFHKQKLNLHPVEIMDKRRHFIGDMSEYIYEEGWRDFSDIKSINLNGNINKLFQLVSDDDKLSFKHLADTNLDFYKYDCSRFLSCFSAFEYEYNKMIIEINQEQVNEDIIKTKNKIIKFIDNMEEGNEKFKKQAKDRILQLGTQVGLKRKIELAYMELEDILKDSIKFIFIRQKFDIGKISKRIIELRNKIAHTNYSIELGDEEIEIARFLDILSYIMVMKRAEIDNNTIEVLIGVVFHCNFKYMGF